MDFVLLDIDVEAAERVAELGRRLNKKRGLSCSFEATNNQEAAFTEVDYVIITITTGGLDSMKHDLRIPESYGVFQTVGDTVGPGGWARALRNIPVFADMAKKIERLSPGAVVLNYTNPLAVLTKVFHEVSKLSCVGLCHGVFETYKILTEIFSKKENEIKVNLGGINHFFWIVDLKIGRDDGYKLLKQKLKLRNLSQLVRQAHKDETGVGSGVKITGELFQYLGYLTYVDRHISEFFPHYLAPNEQKLEKYGLHRTSIKERRAEKKKAQEKLQALIEGQEELSDKPSREIAADIISAMETGREFVDVVNLPNQGQIATKLPR